MKMSDNDFEKLLQSEEKHSYNKTIVFKGTQEKAAGRPVFKRLAVIAAAALLAVGLIIAGVVTAAKTASHGIPTPPDVTETTPAPVTEKDTETGEKPNGNESVTETDGENIQTAPEEDTTAEDITDIQTDPEEDTTEAEITDIQTEPNEDTTVGEIPDIQTETDKDTTGEDITDTQTEPDDETKETLTRAETEEVTTDIDTQKDTNEITTTDTGTEDYKIYLYANGEGGEGDGKTEGYTGKNFLGMADESKKQNMGGKTIEIFGGEQTMLYMKTISFGICDEKYDMYIGDNGLFTFGETTGKLVTYDYLSGGRADGFTPPVNSNSSQQEFIDYAKNVLLEYTGTSVDDCDVSIKQYGSKYDIIFRKRFSGIYRIDDLMVTINNSGDVLKIKARVCDNLFERFKDVKIDAEKLKKQIYDLSYNPSYVSYEILLRAIPDGNELWVIADVNYEYENNGETLCSGTEYITKVAEIPSDQTEPDPVDTEFETWDWYAGTEAE